ncbi:MAG TPA: LamG-like jellyroll fold domain-containing protein, partial [Armatimonadota bacterium]
TDSVDAARVLMAKSDVEAGLKPTDLLLWGTPGTPWKSGAGIVGLYRRDFTLPAGWEKRTKLELYVDGLVIWKTPIDGFNGQNTIYLNGQQVWQGTQLSATYLDVTAAAQAGANRLEIVHAGNGIMANINLLRTVTPDTVQNLAGSWQAVDGPQAVREVTLPGAVETSFIYKDVSVPGGAKGQEVWLHVDSEAVGSSSYVIINGRQRYVLGIETRGNGHPLDVNITPDIRFGAVNRILIGNGGMTYGWKKGKHNFREIALWYYSPGRWSPDGKGIRDALTPKELRQVEAASNVVKNYPLVNPQKLDKPAIAMTKITAQEAAVYTPPAPILDLGLNKASGLLEDQGPHHIPVKTNGTVTPFADRNGRITGVYLQDIPGKSGYLTIPSGPIYKLLDRQSTTLCAWVKPLVRNADNASLVRWYENLSWGFTLDGMGLTVNWQWQKRINADAVLTQRDWQFVALRLDGNRSTLFVNGLEVATQQWDAPLSAHPSDFTIGSSYGKQDFFNAKLAHFTIFPGALSSDDVMKLYLKSQESFALKPGECWPEDNLLQLGLQPVGDTAEIPAELELGPGTTQAQVDGGPALVFDGKTSYLMIKENPHVYLLGTPFSMIFTIRPEVGARGTLFRRYHDEALGLLPDGTLFFDANIGRRNQATFPKAVTMGAWNRMMLSYDGKVVRLFRDGQLLARKDYPGSFSINRNFSLVFGGDNTMGAKIGANVPMALKELTIIPQALEQMPAR